MESLDSYKLKSAVNSFFDQMFYRYTELQHKRDKKFALLERASAGEESFVRRMARDYSSLDISHDRYFQKKVKKQFNSCRGDIKFNEEWGLRAFDRTPLSHKFATEEKHTMQLLDLATIYPLCRVAIRIFFTTGDSEYRIDLHVRYAVMGAIYACAYHLTKLEKLRKKRGCLKKFFCFLKTKIKFLEAKINQHEILFDYNLKKSSFLLNQLPEIRDFIYQDSCANPRNSGEFYHKHVCSYRGNKNLCSVLKMLNRKSYSCYLTINPSL